jgi:plasmid stability protein
MHRKEPPAMATLTLKNVPDELIESLKREAKATRRSLNQETLVRLEQSLAVRWPTAAEKAEQIRRAQARFADLAPLDDAFLDRAKRSGRQ